jgi:hypothetical protein
MDYISVLASFVYVCHLALCAWELHSHSHRLYCLIHPKTLSTYYCVRKVACYNNTHWQSYIIRTYLGLFGVDRVL